MLKKVKTRTWVILLLILAGVMLASIPFDWIRQGPACREEEMDRVALEVCQEELAEWAAQERIEDYDPEDVTLVTQYRAEEGKYVLLYGTLETGGEAYTYYVPLYAVWNSDRYRCVQEKVLLHQGPAEQRDYNTVFRYGAGFHAEELRLGADGSTTVSQVGLGKTSTSLIGVLVVLVAGGLGLLKRRFGDS